MVAALSLAVVGADYPNKRGPARRFETALCRPGEPVHLIPEPKNKVDPNAIQVLSERGVVIGYIAAERALLIGQAMRRGAEVRAIFQGAARWGAIVRVTLDGSEPVLPQAREEAAEQDWWPDEPVPDE